MVVKDDNSGSGIAWGGLGWSGQQNRQGISPQAYLYYVDSVAGSDANSGLSPAAPKQTLAAVRTLALAKGTGASIGLKAGSYWRQSLDLSAISGATVAAYGTGNPPVIDGADIVTAWTKTAGLTTVYQASVTHDATGNNRLTVYEDGVLLTRVTSDSLCDSTAASFVDAKGSDGATLAIKIHATGNGNPASNGKVYEITTRYGGVVGGPSASLSGLYTRRVINNNGSLDCVAKVGSTISRCLASNGTKHNLGMGSGSMTDCIAFAADSATSYELSSTYFVAFLDNGAGFSAFFDRIGIIADTSGTDLISHGNPTGFDSVDLRQTWTVGPCYTGTVNTIQGSYYKDTLTLPLEAGIITKCLFSIGQLGGSSRLGLSGGASITDSVFASGNRVGNGNEILRPQGSGVITLANCAFAGPTAAVPWMSNGTGTWQLVMNKCIWHGGSNQIMLPSGTTYVGNYNVFHVTQASYLIVNQWSDGSYKTTLAAWQAASGQDASSVYLLAADQTSGNSNAFWLGVSTGANSGPTAGDFRINPSARVYSGANVAYIGTFPDGTPITAAGPQTRWNWNTRAAVAGPPIAWPTVPDTLAKAQAYIQDPVAWNFYP